MRMASYLGQVDSAVIAFLEKYNIVGSDDEYLPTPLFLQKLSNLQQQLEHIIADRQSYRPFQGVGLDFLTPGYFQGYDKSECQSESQSKPSIDPPLSPLLVQDAIESFSSTETARRSALLTPLKTGYPGLTSATQDAKGRLKTPRYSLGGSKNNQLADSLQSSPFSVALSPVGHPPSHVDSSLVLLTHPSIVLEEKNSIMEQEEAPLFLETPVKQTCVKSKPRKSVVSKYLDIEAECQDDSSEHSELVHVKDSFVVDDDQVEFETCPEVSLERHNESDSLSSTSTDSLDEISVGNIVYERRQHKPTATKTRALLRNIRELKTKGNLLQLVKDDSMQNESKQPSAFIQDSFRDDSFIEADFKTFREPLKKYESEDDSILIPKTTRKQCRNIIVESDQDSERDDKENYHSPTVHSDMGMKRLVNQMATVEISAPFDIVVKDDSALENWIEDVNKNKSGPLQLPRLSLSNEEFIQQRQALAKDLYKEFNRNVFENNLPHNLDIVWSNLLRKTAGRTLTLKQECQGVITYDCKIELSLKIIDRLDRLYNTLMHEMCHAAAWMMDHTNKPPHGKVFKQWGSKAMKVYSHIEVTTHHTYEVDYKYHYQCTQCSFRFGRHSKSVDVKKQGCGMCAGRLELQ